MSIFPLTVPPKRLAQTISSTDMSFKLNNIRSWNNIDLVPGDFGTEAYCVFINPSRTQIEIFKFDPATIADDSITITARGLGYTGGDVSDPSRTFPWTSNDTIVQLGTDAPQLFRDFMTESNPATVVAQHTYDVLPESAEVPVDDEDFVNKKYVDDKTGSALAVPVTQVAHGFLVGDLIYVIGTNTYAKAQADNLNTSEVVGIVNIVTDADNFSYTTEGIVSVGVPNLPAGTVLFLSPDTAGALTEVEPSTIGHISFPLAVITEPDETMVFHKYRPAVLNTIAGNPIASETVAGIVEQATPAQVAAKTDVGETGAPLFVVPSLIPDPPSKDVQEFTSSGDWNKPLNGDWALIELWGAGGSGGSYATTANSMAAYGGGGGEYIQILVPITALNAIQPVVIGIGGAARTPPFNTTQAGLAGGNTTFAGLVAKGGAGGGIIGNPSTTSFPGGPGAAATDPGVVNSERGADGGGYVAANNVADGGNSLFSGPGGGAAYSNNLGVNTARLGGVASLGISVGGNAAAGGAPAVAQPGVRGGGGGGATSRSGAAESGAGGNGFARITVF